MKLRAIVFSLEWIVANTLVFRVLDKYSFYTFPWILWNITFGIFLTKLFLAPNDDDTKTKTPWPIGPTVGSFGFVLTAIKIDSDESAPSGIIRFSATIVGYCICLLGFALIGLASDALGEEWRDAPPPSESGDSTNTTNEDSKLVPPKRIHTLVTNGPYAIVRHPIYCGLLLEALGSNVVGGFSSWIAIGAFCAVSTAYVIQLGQEERELDLLLEGKYGNVYTKNTRYKLVPFLY